MSSVSLLFGVHAHQPAGNFPEVVDEAHAKSYGPFLRTVHRHPEFRFAIHFSGWLLEYLLEHFPEDMALLSEMVARRQAELFGGGDMEPVLAAIPARDRVGQLNALADRLHRAFGQKPHGGWLTERVWEATVVPSLVAAGIEYVTVDDYHFLCAGRELGELGGYFSTEEDSQRLDLFPISEQLRYRLPFAPAEEAVRYIESLAGQDDTAAAIYFDDIEKFGIWPETYEWVYEKRWLENFIEGVLATPVIRTRHFRDFRREVRTRGVVYLPTTSYVEMGEWTLPAGRADEFAELLEQEKSQGRYERHKPFLRGGIWRNFFSRYAESNWMHKRMLLLSDRLHALAPSARTATMTALLYRSQANDAYWHGLFGGLYLPHLRRAVWNSLVALEAEIDAVQPRPTLASVDMDLDGHEELFLRGAALQAVVRDDAEAAVIELSSYRLNHNFGDTLTRRREHYHRKLALDAGAQAAGTGIASAHDRVSFRHAIAPGDAEPDTRLRALFVDRFTQDGGGTAEAPHYRRVSAEGGAAFAGTVDGGSVQKSIALKGDRLTVRYRFDGLMPGRFETELNLAMPSCDGYLGRYLLDGEVRGGFGQPLEVEGMTVLRMEDGVLGGSLTVRCEPAARLDARPLHTVSQSEAGFEKIMQAATLSLAWSLPGGTAEVQVVISIAKGGIAR
jgi:hypothetical protein